MARSARAPGNIERGVADHHCRSDLRLVERGEKHCRIGLRQVAVGGLEADEEIRDVVHGETGVEAAIALAGGHGQQPAVAVEAPQQLGHAVVKRSRSRPRRAAEKLSL